MPFELAETSQPGVAQLVARVVWDHQAAGSIPVTRTNASVYLVQDKHSHYFTSYFFFGAEF